ncbi:NDP-hexose 2,3-dehydratase family protein [Candidatus Pelagibacter sp.]|nr:NDP-hexose 2,3-dehydratase family protein [Candidatus Pelagibacter sp.]
MLNSELFDWVNKQKIINKLKIKKKDKDKLHKWHFNDNLIYHTNKNFFKIKPYVFEQFKKKWYQPLILQKEEGVLGIIKKTKSNIDYYLLQAKAEPGNINSVQISPTVQATKSNYLRKHGGKKTSFLNFFLKKNKNIKVLSSLKLSEQGTRFLQKKNRNILIEIKNINLPKKSNFRWLTKANIRYLIKRNNVLNMDTISIFSSVIKKDQADQPINSFSELLSTLNKLKRYLSLKKMTTKFSNLKGWKINKFKIYDLKKIFFSIFFIEVKANEREVKNWNQPIISDHFSSLNGFIISKYNDITHYLLKVTHEPGFIAPKFTSTISEKNLLPKNMSKIKFSNLFKKKYYLLNIVNSDEGGRFLKNQSRNIVCQIGDYKKVKLPKNYTWVSHNQIIELINKNLVTIEARNLFACFNIEKIK